MKELKRQILKGPANKEVVSLLQTCLFDLIDLALQGKQAHWNVVGANFRSIHLQLDEIIDAVRLSSDEVAERISTLAHPADGRAAEVGAKSRLEHYPPGLQSTSDTVTLIADRLQQTIQGVRDAIDKLDELDSVSQDLLIGVSAGLEKHLWMVQAQEL